MRLVVMPSTGKVLDFDSMPPFNSQTQKPGKYCPDTGLPCDETALANVDYSLMQHEDARVKYKESCETHVANIAAQLAEGGASVTKAANPAGD